MRQALIKTPTELQVIETATPTLQGPDELLLRMAVSGICSGDLMPWYLQKKVGTVLGHEVVGWAEQVGSNVTHIRQGDLVFVHHHAPCLDCAECRRGAHVHCATWKASHIDPGGMAEWIRIPAVNARHDCFAVNDLQPERAVFIEPLGCSVKAMTRVARLVDLRQPDTLGVVVGCGIMGMLNLLAARAFGVAHLVAVEPGEERRALAPRFGAEQALTPAEAKNVLRRRADFVIIGPGHPEVIRQSLDFLRPAGVALLFTPTSTGVETALDLGDLYFRDISLIPSYSCGPEDTRQAYDLLRTGKVPAEQIVTHRFPLDDIQQAFDCARAGGHALKVLITSKYAGGRRDADWPGVAEK